MKKKPSITEAEIKPPEFDDITRFCKDCGCEFVWERGEQEFFFSKGLAAPKRCPECREKRRLTIVRVGSTDGGGTRYGHVDDVPPDGNL